MTDTNCTEESKNALIHPPKLLGDAQLKISLNPMDSIKQSPFVALFKGGIPLSHVALACKSGMKVAEIGKPSILDKIKLKVDGSGGVYSLNLRCGL